MYNVYINHFKRNNSIIDTEELMFSIPDTDGFPVTKPVVKSSEDSADQFSFSMESNSEFYDSILPKKTMLRVEYDGDIIFYGYAQAPSTSSVFQTKSVTCIGKYAYLNDTYYEGKQEKYREKITISTFLDRIISNHNTMAPSKPFRRGNISISLPSKVDKYEPTSWTQSSSLLSNLTSNHGGHIRARYTSGENVYIDWYKYYIRDLGDDNRPQITVGKNILDISSDTGIDNIFTRIIPIGDSDKSGKTIYLDGYVYTDKNGSRHTYSGKVMPISFIRNLYTDAQLTDEFHDFKDYRDAETNYGIIYKTMSFSDCDTQAKLFDAVKKWIKECYFGLVPSFSVKAIDLHIQDTGLPKILLGDCVDVTFVITINGSTTTVTKKLVCKSVQYDLFNPENNSYTFSIPSDLLEYNKNNKKSSKKTASAQASTKVVPKGDEDPVINWYTIWKMIGDQTGHPEYDSNACYDSFEANGELSGTKKCYDPNEVIDGKGNTIGNNYKDHKDKWFTAKIVGKITLSGKTVKWVAVSEDYGVFAYVDTGEPSAITHYYLQKKGCKFDATDPGMSSFNKIAEIIKKDSDSVWGGSVAATSFVNNKKMSGSIKFFDPDKCTRAQAIADSKNTYTADIVGKFTKSGVLRYVAISKEFGIFGYNATVKPPVPASHWYMQAKGLSYDNIDMVVKDENGNIYITDDGDPEGKKTLLFKNDGAVGSDSIGQLFIGHDTTSQAEKWKIKINAPIRYTDVHGNVIDVPDGFISAEDFNIESIPSFKTEVAVINAAFIDVVYSNQIHAEIEFVDKINSKEISSDTYVSTHYLNADIVSTGDVRAQDYEYHYGDNEVSHLQKCYNYFTISENNGKIFLKMNKADGSGYDQDSFNMAATNFYQNAVAAARENGWEACYDEIGLNYSTNQTLNPGEHKTIYPVAKPTETGQRGVIITKRVTITARDLSLQTRGPIYPSTDEKTIPVSDSSRFDGLEKVIIAGDPDFVESNIKSGVTIWGKTGTYTGSSNASNIQLYAGGSSEITRSSSAPSGAINLGALASTLIGAYQNLGGAGQFVKFPATINGGTGVKYYYIDMRH